MLETITYAATLLLLAIGSATDFKKREVPDWMSYAAIVFGIGIRSIFALTSWSWTPLIEGALGFLPLFILSLIMYYTGQWGGGDSKILMGIGILIGAKPTLLEFPLLLVFFANVVMIGSAYGLLYSLILAILHRKEFVAEFQKQLSAKKALKYICYSFAAACVLASFFVSAQLPRLMLVVFAVFSVCMFYIWIFIKSLEKSVMIKKIPVEKLTEGDWIVDDVRIDGKYICGPKDLGIEKEQIAKLIRLKRRGKISFVMVKEGIPFVPGFLLAFVATLVFGNWIQRIFLF